MFISNLCAIVTNGCINGITYPFNTSLWCIVLYALVNLGGRVSSFSSKYLTINLNGTKRYNMEIKMQFMLQIVDGISSKKVHNRNFYTF